jgi:hypothetical protein
MEMLDLFIPIIVGIIVIMVFAIAIAAKIYCFECNSKLEKVFRGKITKIKVKNKKIIISFNVNDTLTLKKCYITQNTLIKENYLRSSTLNELKNLLKKEKKYIITVDGGLNVKTIEIIDTIL